MNKYLLLCLLTAATIAAQAQQKIKDGTVSATSALPVANNTAQTINTSNWSKGLYYVVFIENGERVHVEKVIKQ